MEIEDDEGPPKAFLSLLGVVMAVVGVLVVAALVVPLQPPPPQPPPPPPVAGKATVLMPAGTGADNNKNFAPASITVYLGVNNTVLWINQDSAIHTVTATDHSFDSGNIQAKGNYTNVFTTVGTYSYYCIYHSWMKGQVVVKQPGAGVKGVSVVIPHGSNVPSGAPGYTPNTILVVLGVNATVTWVNNDSATHSVTSDRNFDSGKLAPGGVFSYTFTAAGTYAYRCVYHAWMTGTVVVKA